MSGRILLRDVILKHDVPVRTRYGTTHVLVFYDPKNCLTWIWKTSKPTNFTEHCSYSITGRDEGDYYLSHVQEYDNTSTKDEDAIKSERPDECQDLWDTIFKECD